MILIAALAAFSISAQVAKVEPKTTVDTPPPTERQLTKDEVTSFELASARIQVLRAKFHIDDYEKEAKPFQDTLNGIFVAACKSVGVSEELIQKGSCGFTVGVDQEGKPLLGPDGKPITARVVFVKPTQPVVDKK